MYLKLTSNWQALERVTADEWMRRRAGTRIYDAVWKPMLIGKFGEENFEAVNMAWLWARIKSRTTRLGTFVGGFQAFMDKLDENLMSFLSSCFLRDPSARPTARQLLEHPWITCPESEPRHSDQ